MDLNQLMQLYQLIMRARSNPPQRAGGFLNPARYIPAQTRRAWAKKDRQQAQAQQRDAKRHRTRTEHNQRRAMDPYGLHYAMALYQSDMDERQNRIDDYYREQAKQQRQRAFLNNPFGGGQPFSLPRPGGITADDIAAQGRQALRDFDYSTQNRRPPPGEGAMTFEMDYTVPNVAPMPDKHTDWTGGGRPPGGPPLRNTPLRREPQDPSYGPGPWDFPYMW